MAMTMEEVKKLIMELNICTYTGDWDVCRALYNRDLEKEIKVSDGASKICLIFKNSPYVIKWSPDGYQEAMREVEIYKKAESVGLEKFFPKTVFFFSHNGIDFVMQEKIDTDCYSLSNKKKELYKQKSRTASARIIKKMEKRIWEACGGEYAHDLDETWASLALVLYGKAVCKSLCDFIVENNINDLHVCNIGYKKDRPILLDFSGYNRNYNY